MEQYLKKTEIKNLVENVNLYSKRLCCILKLFELNNVNISDKVIICDYVKEIAYNINAEIQNISLIIAD